jgi:hypothetical protein
VTSELHCYPTYEAQELVCEQRPSHVRGWFHSRDAKGFTVVGRCGSGRAGGKVKGIGMAKFFTGLVCPIKLNHEQD